MGLKRISQLDEITAVNTEDYLIINQNGTTKKAKVGSLKIPSSVSGSGAGINDDDISAEETWSSTKISNTIAALSPTNFGSITVTGGGIAFVNLSEFGAVGDGITDDTTAFQNALNSGKNITAEQGKNYLITYPLQMSKSNQIVDMQNALITFKHSLSKASASTNSKGVFDIYSRSLAFADYIPTAIYLSQGYATFSSHGFSVGDFARIFLDAGTNSTTTLKPKCQLIARVMRVDGNKVYFDYIARHLAWNLDTTSPSSKYTASCKIQKVTGMLENVQLRNIRIYDTTPFVSGFTPSGASGEYADYYKYCACGIYAKFCSNLVVDNFTMSNQIINAMTVYMCYNYKIKNVTARNSRLWSAGIGYLLQNQHGHKFHLENLNASRVRHTCDTSGGAYGKIQNVHAYHCYNTDVVFHGNWEHDVSVDNCHGVDRNGYYCKFGAGSGLSNFGNASDNIRFSNSDVSVYMWEHFGRIEFEGCHVILEYLPSRAKFSNCNIYTREPMGANFYKRGQDFKYVFQASNCEITQNGGIAITSYETVLLNGCILRGNLKFTSTKDLIANGCSITSMIYINGTGYSSNSTGSTSTGKYILSNNIFG